MRNTTGVPLRTAVALIALALCALLPSSASAQAPPRRAAIGLSASLRYLRGDTLTTAVERLRRAHVQYSREDLKWQEIERRPGRYDWRVWDRTVAAAARGGVRIMPVPLGSPAWATGAAGRPPAPGRALERFAAFVRAAVARYGTTGSFWRSHPKVPKVPVTMWDIWNEPYFGSGWGANVDPVGYATLFRRVVEVARPADRRARFMLEADTGSGTGSWPQPPFLGAMFDAFGDLAAYADVVALHPYTSELNPTRCTPYDPDPGFRTAWLATRFQFCRVRDVRRILDAYGATSTPLWITELGWTTAPEYDRAISERTQARYIAATFRLLRRWRLVDGVLLYNLMTTERNRANQYDWYGFLHADGRPKPAWRTFVAEVRRGLPAAIDPR